eukprot:TRINITY_DN64569_c0_g1_i1.p1 TRINITY_DN64569_c0_g1~~TRINITY_DN64569_c0_g1_i1.p1  ORF type:complete len:809 (+),score=138.95 TRINITY_DN64569_c0_g1_i1:49-2475(+)
MAEVNRIMRGGRRKNKSPPHRHPRGAAPVLLSPAHAPPAGTVSHETYQILKWSPFDLADPAYRDPAVQPLPKKASTPEPHMVRTRPPPPTSFTPSPQRVPNFAERRGIPRKQPVYRQPVPIAAAPPPPIRQQLRPLADPPLLPSSNEQLLYEQRETLQQLKAERKKLEQLHKRSKAEGDRMKFEKEQIKQHELELEIKVEQRRSQLAEHRDKERDAERRREAEWANIKQLYSLEIEAESSFRDMVVVERREREKLEDEFRRREAEVYFLLQERAIAAEEEDRLAQRLELLRKAQEWQHMLAVNSVAKEESAQRQVVQMQEQQEIVELHSSHRYAIALFVSITQRLRSEEEAEREARGNIKFEEAQELDQIYAEHEIVVREEETLRELERVEFVGYVLQLVRGEEDNRLSIEVDERAERRQLGDLFTHEVECFVMKLQEFRTNENRIRSLLDWEEMMEERANILLDEKEECTLAVQQQERWDRHKIEELFFLQGDDLTYHQFLDCIDDLVDEEADARWHLQKHEEHSQQYLLRWQILMLDETSTRIEIQDTEAFSRQQLDMIEVMAKRVESNLERERVHEERLNRLEKLDVALGMSVLQGADKKDAAIAIQKMIRMYLAKKHVDYMKQRLHSREGKEETQWKKDMRYKEKKYSPTKAAAKAKQQQGFNNTMTTAATSTTSPSKAAAAQQHYQQQQASLMASQMMYDPYMSMSYYMMAQQQQQQQMMMQQQYMQALYAQQQQQPQNMFAATAPSMALVNTNGNNTTMNGFNMSAPNYQAAMMQTTPAVPTTAGAPGQQPQGKPMIYKVLQ